VEVQESGASSWSTDPAAALPGEQRPAIVVIVESTADDPIDSQRLDALVSQLKPAHVLHRLQINEG
jgi:hypothetical protein